MTRSESLQGWTNERFYAAMAERGKDPESVKTWLKCYAARMNLFSYCQVMAPAFYRNDRPYLRELCDVMQGFVESDQLVLIVNMPPRHGKSYTATHLVEWALGRNPATKVMTCSYNETLSTRFSKAVRNDIQEIKAEKSRIVYSDIFPKARIKEGDAAMNLWSLEGQEVSYLATSPGGTATGMGADLLIIDDIIKNAEEAYNRQAKNRIWQWFADTMLSRLEEGGKIIAVMTRWATDDIAGRLLAEFPEAVHVDFKAIQPDGSMLCPDILSRASCESRRKLMGADIWSANYQQEPIDLKDRLYSEGFKTYTEIPTDATGRPLFSQVKAYCDTADTGSDFLCLIVYGIYDGDAYVLDVLYTQDPMEITEPETARILDEQGVTCADIESNNGGRGFARNVERLLRERKNRRCAVRWFTQRANKQARILSNATNVMRRLIFPQSWKVKWPDFYRDMAGYQRAGKNAHDDCADAATGVIEKMEERPGLKISGAVLRGGII